MIWIAMICYLPSFKKTWNNKIWWNNKQKRLVFFITFLFQLRLLRKFMVCKKSKWKNNLISLVKLLLPREIPISLYRYELFKTMTTAKVSKSTINFVSKFPNLLLPTSTQSYVKVRAEFHNLKLLHLVSQEWT